MCGIGGVAGGTWSRDVLETLASAMQHRGPDDRGAFRDDAARVGLVSTRLGIVDRSDRGHQPMRSADGSLMLVFNGEIYNHRELRHELSAYPFRGDSDTEVLLAALQAWGLACLDRVDGMFAFAVWDSRRQRLTCVRDRFGVKPLYYAFDAVLGHFRFASEPTALLATGIADTPNLHAWRQYLAYGLSDHGPHTFFRDIQQLPAGHLLEFDVADASTAPRVRAWYDLVSRVLARYPDARAEAAVEEEYLALLESSVSMRLRADVPIGVALSGGLDSALLLALARKAPAEPLDVFTFTTGDPQYDEAKRAHALVEGTRERWWDCRLSVADLPTRCAEVAAAVREPFGGVPTVAYAGVFASARAHGALVVLDGQGLDEPWGGYDYYRSALDGPVDAAPSSSTMAVQGSVRFGPSMRARLQVSFFDSQRDAPDPLPTWGADRLLEWRVRDVLYAKLPRALRFNDRISMMHGVELREPLLDYRLMELALAQPASRIIHDGHHKRLLRRIASRVLPASVVARPKQAVQTPQREWLAGPLATWVQSIVTSSPRYHEWFLDGALDAALDELRSGQVDHSVAVWQMLSVALADTSRPASSHRHA